VGGLPQSPQPPFFYKAPFSPIDVIEEYTRPARLREKGQLVTKEALSEREMMTFDGVGILEAFNTDGLRSLLYTLPHIPEMKEKTLRYPGHIDLIIALRDSGFFETSPKMMGALSLSPIEFTATLLMDNWKLGGHEPELTVMKVIVEGEENGSPKKVVYDLLDFYDRTTGLSSMSRSTGYTCTAALQLIIKGLFTQKGVYPPEFVGSEEVCFDFVIQYLKERGVEWTKKES
jgi:saccharopine dehydrogenase-like NADP-dependent oxidoreductase